jgi:hypothetical protein
MNGGSVCESNAPATPVVPPAGFEDRDRHRTTNASSISYEQSTFRSERLRETQHGIDLLRLSKLDAVRHSYGEERVAQNLLYDSRLDSEYE